MPVHSSRGRSWTRTCLGDGAAGEAGGAVQPGRLVHGLGLAEDRGAGVSGVAEHAPDHRPVPAFLPGAGAHPLVRQPAAQVRDGRAVVGVAAEHLRDQHGLVLDDLVEGPGPGGLAEVPVAERGAGQHVDAAGPGPPGLAAPVPLHQLGLLVLGEHALELDQQLVLGAVAPRPLHELHPRPAAGELLDQQRLVGEIAGQPVRGVDQHDVEAALGGQVAQRLQRRPHQRRAGVPVVGNTQSSGTSSRLVAACSRSADSWEPIVWSFACRALETLASIAAAVTGSSLRRGGGGPGPPLRHQYPVGH